MANKSMDIKRIVFQPTAKNREKLLAIAENNGVSFSVILNLLLDELDENTTVDVRLIKSSDLTVSATDENND